MYVGECEWVVEGGRGCGGDDSECGTVVVSLLSFFLSPPYPFITHYDQVDADCETWVDRAQLDALPPNATDLSFGNAVYRIKFDDRNSRPTFGHRYSFFLQDAVEDVPEYIVHWDNFVRYAFLFPTTSRLPSHIPLSLHPSVPAFLSPPSFT